MFGRSLWVWLGVGNVLLGSAVALAPGMSSDLLSIRSWLDAWHTHSLNPYAQPQLLADWPPSALVPLSPLYLIPAWLLPAAWLPFNVLTTVAACRYFADTFTNGSEEADTAFWMLLSFGAVRSGLWHGQLTMAALVAGWGALKYRTSIVAGLMLALAMAKPHVALPFAALLALKQRFALIGVCAALLAAWWAIFAASLGDSLAESVGTYLGALQVYAGEDFRRSASDVRSLAGAIVPWPASDYVSAVLVVAGAALIAVTFLRARGRPDLSPRLFALVALWSLAAFHQQRYNMILAGPAMMLLGLHLRSAGWLLRVMHWALILEAGWIAGRVVPALDPRLEDLMAAVNLPAVVVIVLFCWLVRDTWSRAGTVQPLLRRSAQAS